MTIKQATAKMLRNIYQAINSQSEKRVYDKEIAEKLGITAAAYSRLNTQVTRPDIMTWFKIYTYHKNVCGDKKTAEIINEIECV